MIRRMLLAAGLLLATALQAGVRPAAGQVMFLDMNGDGVWTNDAPNRWGPTTIDVYLITDQDYGGSPILCTDGAGLDVNSYTVNLYAYDAPVSFTSVTNMMAGMTEVVPLVTYPYALTVGYGGTESFPPGKHHLLRITAEFGSGGYGCPALEIISFNCYSPPGVVTSFGSSCPGQRSDYTLRLNEDWWDVAGFSCSDPLGSWPSLSCPGTISGAEGQPLTFPVTLTFAPGCHIFSFNVYGLPPGATFSGLSPFVAGEASGSVTWTPGAGQAGSYAIQFDASQYPNPFHMVTQRDTCTTQITIVSSNVAPLAEAGGPYSGVQGVPVTFNGTGSTDPNGDALQFAWAFGDGTIGSGSISTHTYVVPGDFTSHLTVTDPRGLTASDFATVSIARDLPVRVFTSGSNGTTRLPHGKPMTCFRIESSSTGSFVPAEVLPETVTLRYTDPICGPLEAHATAAKAAPVADADRNGVLEYEACFSRSALSTVAACLPGGTSVVQLDVSGSLASGDRFHGTVMHTMISGGGSLSAAVAPNPIGEATALEFTTRTAGFATARLYDIRGRLVATVFDNRLMPAGSHQMALGSLHRLHGRLASGVYFLSIRTEHDGSETRAVTIMR